MSDNKFEELRNNYMETPIPEELDFVVNKALKESSKKMTKRDDGRSRIRIAVASLVAALTLFTIGVNTSPVFAQAMLDLPLVGKMVEVVTLRTYIVDQDTFNANLEVPAVSGLENKGLENSLNEKYLKENEALYEQFKSDMEDVKEMGGSHLGVDSGYVIKTDNDRILSIGRYVVNTVGSSSTVFKYDTIDKKKEILLTLPSLFKDDSYIDIMSENIKSQMIEQSESDENKIYWIQDLYEEGVVSLFEKISPEQSFYINSDNKLVVSFDKYEVAPGFMGVIDFVIPTEVIADVLVGNEYIN